MVFFSLLFLKYYEWICVSLSEVDGWLRVLVVLVNCFKGCVIKCVSI